VHQFNARFPVFLNLDLQPKSARLQLFISATIKKLTDAEDFGTANLLLDILRALNLQL